jgi:hypothetical protein
MGWEVKAGQVDDFSRMPIGKPLTLMTPEPTGGVYHEHGVESFVRTFGYADKRGRTDRLNFGGVFRAGAYHEGTKLTLRLQGFDGRFDRITDAGGSLALVTNDDTVAASWSFAALAAIWNRKHAQAVYVPAEKRTAPSLQYRYAPVVRLGEGTDFLRLLSAIDDGVVYYDPALKIEAESGSKPRTKARSQFRIRSGDLPRLYRSMEGVTVTSAGG